MSSMDDMDMSSMDDMDMSSMDDSYESSMDDIDMSSMDDPEVPMCDTSVLYVVMGMLSQECQGVLMAAMSGASDNTEMSCEECACYTEITPEAFFEATGVSADSCGAGSGYSFLDEIEMCRRYMEHCDDSDSDESSMDDPAHCDVCVSEFVMYGGCECEMDESCDAEDMVPEGCMDCVDELEEACGIDMSSMDDDVPCTSHDDCGEDTPFCYDGFCDTCDQCQNCFDGIDGTCGPCGATTSGDTCDKEMWTFTVSMVMTENCTGMAYTPETGLIPLGQPEDGMQTMLNLYHLEEELTVEIGVCTHNVIGSSVIFTCAGDYIEEHVYLDATQGPVPIEADCSGELQYIMPIHNTCNAYTWGSMQATWDGYCTAAPTKVPTTDPVTSDPSVSPTFAPSNLTPSVTPSSSPSTSPSTSEPTMKPTMDPVTSDPTVSPTSKPSKSPVTSQPTAVPTVAETGFKVKWELVFGALTADKFEQIKDSLKKVIAEKANKAIGAISGLRFTAASRRRRLNGGTVAADIIADDQSDMNSVQNTLSGVTEVEINSALNAQYATDGITDGPSVTSVGTPVSQADAVTTNDGDDSSSNSTVIIIVVVLVVLIAVAAAGIGGYMYMNKEEEPKTDFAGGLELADTDSSKRSPETTTPHETTGGASLDDIEGQAGETTIEGEGFETNMPTLGTQ